MTEVRVTDPDTGGAKGSKSQRYDLIPPDALHELATLYGVGCGKYEARNWERGYAWGLSFAAMMRHAWAWWRGQEVDPETGLDHMTHVAWHAFTLAEFRARGIGRDDRGLTPQGLLARAARGTAATLGWTSHQADGGRQTDNSLGPEPGPSVRTDTKCGCREF